MQAFSYKNKETGTQVYLENNQIRDAPLCVPLFSANRVFLIDSYPLVVFDL